MPAMTLALCRSPSLRPLTASSIAERVASSARSMDSSAARAARCLVRRRAPTTTNAVERKIFPVRPDSGDALIPPPAGGIGLAELVEVLDELVAAGVEL